MVAGSLRRGAALLLLMALSASCRKEAYRLEDVQKVAYTVRPAVARVNAIASARFSYKTDSVRKIAEELRRSGYVLGVPPPAPASLELVTGAGGSGSGFIIRPDGYLLTSGHVVAPMRRPQALRVDLLRNGAIAALVRHVPVDVLRALYRDDRLEPLISSVASSGTLSDMRITEEVELSNGQRAPFRVLRFSPSIGEHGADLALLKIDRGDLPTLSLADSDAVRVGTSVWAIGYPAVASSTDEVIGGWLSHDSDLEPTFNPGTITAIKRNLNNGVVLQTNVAIYRGNSGGPVVDLDGEVVGVSTWGHTEAEQIKFLVPSDVAREMVSAAKLPRAPEGGFDAAYRSALTEASEGDWSAARGDLRTAAPRFRNSPDVVRFGRDIDRAIQRLPFWQLHPMASATSIAAMLLLFVFLAWPRGGVRPAGGEEVRVAPSSRGGLGAVDGAALNRLLGRFTILNGERAGEKLGLGGSGIRIGRESSICEIVLENPKVSRLHAEVVSIDGKVMLIDRNSSNGTYINDRRIDRQYLRDGDIIYFGGRNAVAVAFHS
jgi:S1-C subfamily serine protease